MFLTSMSGVNPVAQFFTLLVVFILVIGLTYWTTRFIGGYQKNVTKNSNFQVMDTYRISNNKYLQIIKIGSKYVAIAVSKDGIQMLTELQEEDVTLPDYSNRNDMFEKIFEKIKNTKNQPEKNKEQAENDESK